MPALTRKTLLAALGMAACVPVAQAAEATPPSIIVSGEAIARLSPDQATLPLTAQAEAKDVKAAKAQADQRLKSALKVIQEAGIAEQKVKTQYTQIMPQYDYPQNGKPVLRGYVASTALEVTVDDLAKLAPLMDALVKAGIDRIGSVQFGLADEKKARDGLLAQAVKDARAKADSMAAAAGVKAGRPLTISEQGGSLSPRPPMPMARMAMAMDKAEAAPDLPSGQLELRQSVSVTFSLE